jgi:aspartate-semialdehyde dehydrogenase
MKIAVVGITGLVGKVFLKVMEERNFPVTELLPVASKKSVGKTISFQDNEYEVIDNATAIKLKPDIALFSAGSKVSLEWAEQYAETGCTVIDNSSAWRMNPGKKLIIPEINGDVLTKYDRIIANPNCSTIQMLLALAPLHKEYKIKRVIVSTYQSVTGTGAAAVDQMENERKGLKAEMAYPHPIDKNCLPHCGEFSNDGYTAEEIKLVNETKKILDENIDVSATAVRVPVVGGHSESVNAEFDDPIDIKKIKSILSNTPGVTVQDDVKNNIYPMPLLSQNSDEVFVGRIRIDFSQPNSINMWIVADNLRKGAATNAVQIAELVIRYKVC